MDKIIMLKTNELVSAPDNPFKITMDYQMEQLIESIASTGVLVPIIVRSTDDGYEIVSGHRRRYACEYLEISEIPAIVRELDRDSAIIALVDSNLQRENILPSEKAFAYKIKLEAIKHQGKACGQLVHKSRDEVSDSESGRQIQRHIRLTYLIPELLQMVDEGRIAFTPAVELSYLTEAEQRALLTTIESEDRTPSLSQAQKMKGLSQAGMLDMDKILDIMVQVKGNQKEYVKIQIDEKYSRYIGASHTPTPKETEKFIKNAIDYYVKYLDHRRLREQERDLR